MTEHPHWDMVLEQCGRGLDAALEKDTFWTGDSGILLGRDYLTIWIACLLQQPRTALPYLFFYGPQNCGKSMFNVAVSLLLKDRAVQADLVFQRPFNSELQDAEFCWLEEADFSKPSKLQLLTDYVTRPLINIKLPDKPTRTRTNKTHWCQTAGTLDACPKLPSQWVTTIPVPELETVIPTKQFLEALKDELPAFRESMVTLWIPQPSSRSLTAMPVLGGVE